MQTFQQGKFTRHKQSRMHSRILLAQENEPSFRLIAPSLSEVLRKTPAQIEVSLEESYAAGTAGFGSEGFVANPRRRRAAPVLRVGRTQYKATSKGYRIINGRHAGRTYTTKDFGPFAKMALILDHM